MFDVFFFFVNITINATFQDVSEFFIKHQVFNRIDCIVLYLFRLIFYFFLQPVHILVTFIHIGML